MTAQHRNLSEAIRNARMRSYLRIEANGRRGREQYLRPRSDFPTAKPRALPISESGTRFNREGPVTACSRTFPFRSSSRRRRTRGFLGEELCDSFRPPHSSRLLGGCFSAHSLFSDSSAGQETRSDDPTSDQKSLPAAKQVVGTGKCEAINKISPGTTERAAISPQFSPECVRRHYQ